MNTVGLNVDGEAIGENGFTEQVKEFHKSFLTSKQHDDEDLQTWSCRVEKLFRYITQTGYERIDEHDVKLQFIDGLNASWKVKYAMCQQFGQNLDERNINQIIVSLEDQARRMEQINPGSSGCLLYTSPSPRD